MSSITKVYKKDYEWWKRAFELATYGEHRVRVGAFAVVSGVPIAGAWNRIRNTSLVDFTDISIHAEIACINQVSERLRPKTTLYIARVGKDGFPLTSYPCAKCVEQLKETGIKAVCVVDLDVNEQGKIDHPFLIKYKL